MRPRALDLFQDGTVRCASCRRLEPIPGGQPGPLQRFVPLPAGWSDHLLDGQRALLCEDCAGGPGSEGRGGTITLHLRPGEAT